MARPNLKLIPFTPQQAARFWKKVRKGTSDECWEWQGYVHRYGYGKLGIAYGYRYYRWLFAHRVAYYLTTGKDPGKLNVCHHCDNRRCCNPNHLFLGTHTDNFNDMRAKGRNRAPGPGRMPSRVGELNPCARHSPEKIQQARQMSADGIGDLAISKELNIPRRTVYDITRRRKWKHL